MYASILVPLDGSSFGEHALPLAINIARRSDSVLHLAHVHVADAQRSNDATLDAQQRERAYLASVAERLATKWRGRIETTLLAGPIAETIATYTESRHIDL